MTTAKQRGDILVIDDSPTSRTWARVVLRRAGYQVREAEDSEAALAMIAQDSPDLILLDVLLPGMDGYQMTRRLRQDASLSPIPIILLTTLGDVDSKVRGLEAGANDFLTKPPDESELLARVKTLLRLKRSRQELLAEKAKTELLYRVSRELSAELDLDTLLLRVLDLTVASIGASGGSIVLLDEREKSIRQLSRQRDGVTPISQEVWDEVMGKGLTGWVIENKQGAIVPDTRQDSRWIVVDEGHAAVRSVLAVPLVQAGQVVGVLTLTHEKVDCFTPDHFDLVSSIAAQSAVVIDKAHAYLKEQLRARQLELVNGVGRWATSILEPSRLLKEVARLICQAFDYYYVQVGLREGDELIFEGWDFGRDPDLRLPPTRLKLSDQSLVTWVASQGQPLLAPDVGQEPRHRPIAELPDTVTELVMPLQVAGEIVGVLDIQSDRYGQLTEEELSLMETLASQVAVALNNARLYTETERERAKLAAVLAATVDVVVVTDPSGKPLLLNPAAERAFGVRETEAVGLPLEQAIPNPALIDLFRRGAQETPPHVAEIPLAGERILYASVAGVEGVGYVAVMQDITHLKELDRIKSEFVSMVSHDLRSPITAIRGYADLMLPRIDGELKEFAERIRVRSIQMAELIEDLLDLGKIEVGIELDYEPCQLQEIVAPVVQEAGMIAQAKGLDVTSSLPPDLPLVLGDPKQLRRAVDNLLSNAIKYTPAGGRVSVRVWQEEDGLIVAVQDTGLGIPRESLPRLFGKFYRVQTAETEDIPGTGLGLAITKAIVEQHQGRVWVESELGQGSIFGFSLPLQIGTPA